MAIDTSEALERLQDEIYQKGYPLIETIDADDPDGLVKITADRLHEVRHATLEEPAEYEEFEAEDYCAYDPQKSVIEQIGNVYAYFDDEGGYYEFSNVALSLPPEAYAALVDELG